MAGMAIFFVLVALLVATVAALPNTLMEDTKQAAQLAAESDPIINKVKRAQEVLLYGNQQNHPSAESKFYPADEKRASSKHETDEELPTALPIAISSTTKSKEGASKLGHHEQQSNSGKAPGRGTMHYPKGQRAQYHQVRNNNMNEQSNQGRGKTVSQYEKGYQYGVGKEALDKHVENALLKSELYGDPAAVNQYHYYGGSSERKRNQHLTYQSPSKRSYRPEIPFVLPPDDLTSSRSRLKRDLELDPEDVLTMLSLWEAEHRAKGGNPGLDPSWYSYYGLDGLDSVRGDEEEDMDEDEDTSQIDGGWLEGPVPHPSISTGSRYRLERRGGYYYPILSSTQQYPMYPAQKRDSSQWGGFTKDKRFMVSRKRQVSTPRDDVQTLAQLLNHPYRDPGVPLYRRVVL